MNLIEQLGGYGKAKEIFLANKNNWDFYYSVADGWYSDAKHIGHDCLNISCLEGELLQYRREHGIFEFGDAMVIPSRGNGIFHFNALFSDSDIAEARHATDAEIKAGYRL